MIRVQQHKGWFILYMIVSQEAFHVYSVLEVQRSSPRSTSNNADTFANSADSTIFGETGIDTTDNIKISDHLVAPMRKIPPKVMRDAKPQEKEVATKGNSNISEHFADATLTLSPRFVRGEKQHKRVESDANGNVNMFANDSAPKQSTSFIRDAKQPKQMEVEAKVDANGNFEIFEPFVDSTRKLSQSFIRDAKQPNRMEVDASGNVETLEPRVDSIGKRSPNVIRNAAQRKKRDVDIQDNAKNSDHLVESMLTLSASVMRGAKPTESLEVPGVGVSQARKDVERTVEPQSEIDIYSKSEDERKLFGKSTDLEGRGRRRFRRRRRDRRRRTRRRRTPPPARRRRTRRRRECSFGYWSSTGQVPCNTCVKIARRRRSQSCTDCPSGQVTQSGSDFCQSTKQFTTCGNALSSEFLDGVRSFSDQLIRDMVIKTGKPEWEANGVQNELINTLQDYRRLKSSATDFAAAIGDKASAQLSNLALAAVAMKHGSRGAQGDDRRKWAETVETHVQQVVTGRGGLLARVPLWDWYEQGTEEFKKALLKLGMYALADEFEFGTRIPRSAMISVEPSEKAVKVDSYPDEFELESVVQDGVDLPMVRDGVESVLQDEIEVYSNSEDERKLFGKFTDVEGRRSGKGSRRRDRRRAPTDVEGRRSGKGSRRRRDRRRAPPPTYPPEYAKECFVGDSDQTLKELSHFAGFHFMDSWRSKYRIFQWLVDNDDTFCEWKWFVERRLNKQQTVNALHELANPSVHAWLEAPQNENYAADPELAFADMADLAKVVASFMSGLEKNPPDADVLDAQAKGMEGASRAGVIIMIANLGNNVLMDLDQQADFYKPGESAKIQSTILSRLGGAGTYCASPSVPPTKCSRTSGVWLRIAIVLFKNFFCAEQDREWDECNYMDYSRGAYRRRKGALVEGGFDLTLALADLAMNGASLHDLMQVCYEGEDCIVTKGLELSQAMADVATGVYDTIDDLCTKFCNIIKGKIKGYYKSVTQAIRNVNINAIGKRIWNVNTFLNNVVKAAKQFIKSSKEVTVTLADRSLVLISKAGQWHVKSTMVKAALRYAAGQTKVFFNGHWRAIISAVTPTKEAIKVSKMVERAKLNKFTLFLTVVGIAFDLYTLGTAIQGCTDGNIDTECDMVTGGLALVSAIGGVISIAAVLVGLGPVGLAIGTFIMVAAALATLLWGLFKPKPAKREETTPEDFRNAWCCEAARDGLDSYMVNNGTDYTKENPCRKWVTDNCGCDWGAWDEPKGDCTDTSHCAPGDCFPSSAKVYIKEYGIGRIDNLQKGSLILSVDDSGRTFYDEVSFYSLADPERKFEPFLAIGTSMNRTIRISGGHHVPAGLECCGKLSKAKDLRVGDLIWTVAPGDQMATLDTVKFIDMVVDDGLQSPVMLQGGHPIVDGVVTSFDDPDSMKMAVRWLPFFTRVCTAGKVCETTATLIKKYECFAKGECSHREIIKATGSNSRDIDHAKGQYVAV